ncbi:saccharopine dehydrogenase NADP-binding domain-containing protein [Bosea sp. LjRoot237]|uniref:saccharopine dehydrogenase NADP-binding domain-containing protein n=1 Tax=Bosea sp. LjRoot237 TaxID=3342292 RepID=UPI003ED06F01
MADPAFGAVLILGGYGSVGSRTARALRQLHPEMPLVIAGRDLAKAQALVAELGHASIAPLDLERDDLGLPADLKPAVVLMAVRDLSLRTQSWAAAQGAAYVALSDGVFEVGPAIAGFIRRPKAAPVVLLGHSMGAVPALAALHAARDFERVDEIEVGLVFDPADPLGLASQKDMDRIGAIGPAPLVKSEGLWCWITAPQTERSFTGVDGRTHQGATVGLVDVFSLSASEAKSVRVDFAEGQTASTLRGEKPSHEVIIEITGKRRDGREGRFRWELVDPDGYAALSAKGITVVIEGLFGLAGKARPTAGLHLPETLVETSHLMRRLGEFGIAMREV